MATRSALWVAETSVREWVQRIRAEYLEMPGLSLTKSQMLRLWRMDASLCDAVVDALVESGFLRLRADLTYRRVQERP